jgi:hypothetical protein
MFEGPKNQYEHVSRDSEEVQALIEKMRQESSEYDQSFKYTEDAVKTALKFLDKIHKFKDKYKDFDGDIDPEGEKKVKSMEDSMYFQLRTSFKYFLQNASVAVRTSLIRDVISDPDLRDQVAALPTGLYDVDKLEPELLEKVFKKRIERNEERKNLLAESWEEIMAKVHFLLEEGIKNGSIKRDLEYAFKILELQRMSDYDSFFVERNAEGAHNSALQTIEFDLSTSIEDMPHVILHEMIHALSGVSILKTTSTDSEKVEETKIRNQKVGLMYTKIDHESGKINGRKWVWLNEAVTEEITSELCNDDYIAYSKERRKLKRLCELGIDREIIYNAYFEDYNPDDPERVPHWKKFVAELKRVFPDLSVVQALEKVSSDVDEEIEQEKIANEKTQS